MKPCTPANISGGAGDLVAARLDELELRAHRMHRFAYALSIVLGLVVAFRVTLPLALELRDSQGMPGKSSAGPTGRTAAIAVDNTSNTQLRDSSTSTHLFGICSVITSGLNVFLVEEDASDTSEGEGPYCDTCTNGPRFIVGGKDFARASSSSGTVRCRFYDAPLGAMDAGGGVPLGVADSRFVNVIGDTMTGGLTFSGVTADVTTATNEDMEVSAAGTGSVRLKSGDNAVEVLDSNGNVDLTFSTATSSQPSGIFGDTSTQARIGFNGGVLQLGTHADVSATTVVTRICENPGSTATTPFLEVYGEGAVRVVPNDALVLGASPDTTSTPLGSGTAGAGTACRMSAGAPTAWTVSETGAVNGMFFCCTNTGANAITMTDSAGVYEGSGSVVGQWDQVCFEYVTDRWVERSFKDN